MADVNTLTASVSANTTATNAGTDAIAKLVASGGTTDAAALQVIQDQIDANTANLNAAVASIPVK
jgi:hypothetical protein